MSQATRNAPIPDALTSGAGTRSRGVARVGRGAQGSRAESRGVRPVAVALLLCGLGVWAMVGPVLWLLAILAAMGRFVPALAMGLMRGTEVTEATESLRRALGFYRRGFAVATDAVFPVDGEGA